MFNLLVSSDGGAWEQAECSIDANRFKEYSGAEANAISLTDPTTLKKLERVPAVLIYEVGATGPDPARVRIGRLREIVRVGSKICFRLEPARTRVKISRERILEFAARLGIAEFEFRRTHWAIKDGDLPRGLLEPPRGRPRNPAPRPSLLISPRPKEKSSPLAPDGSVDVLILTAITLEYRGALEVDDGATGPWRHEETDAGLPLAFRTFNGPGGRHVRVALTQAPDMGAGSATAALLPLALRYKPRCLAMCGVCAGRPGKTNLGDVIAAERLFYHDSGKQLLKRVQQDIRTYNLRDEWKVKLEHFRALKRFETAEWLRRRPIPYSWQEDWVLAKLREGVKDPSALADATTACPQWEKVIVDLWSQGCVRDGRLEITERGRKRINRVLIQHQGRLPDVSPLGSVFPFSVRVAPVGSGNKVIEDAQVWGFVSDHMRKTLGLDMEAVALGALAEVMANSRTFRRQRPEVLVMKAVMDFASDGKDDHFKSFAARASAECLIAFLREQLEVESDTQEAVPLDAEPVATPTVTTRNVNRAKLPAGDFATLTVSGERRYRVVLEGTRESISAIELCGLLDAFRNAATDATLTVTAIDDGSIVANVVTRAGDALRRSLTQESIVHPFGFRVLRVSRATARPKERVSEWLAGALLRELSRPSPHIGDRAYPSSWRTQLSFLVEQGEVNVETAEKARRLCRGEKSDTSLTEAITVASAIRHSRLISWLVDDFGHHIVWPERREDKGRLLSAIAACSPDFDYDYGIYVEATDRFSRAREKHGEGERRAIPLDLFVEALEWRSVAIEGARGGEPQSVSTWTWPASWGRDVGWDGPVIRQQDSVFDSERLERAIRRYRSVELDRSPLRAMATVAELDGRGDLVPYRVGNVSARAWLGLLGGGDVRFGRDDIKFQYEHQPLKLPGPVEAEREEVVARLRQKADREHVEFFNGPTVRLHAVSLNTHQDPCGEEKKAPRLELRPTCWYDYAVSNQRIDDSILVPGRDAFAEPRFRRATIRSEYADERAVADGRIDQLQLTNMLTVTVVLLTKDCWTLLGRRTSRVDNHSGLWAASVAENIHRWKDEPSVASDFWSPPNSVIAARYGSSVPLPVTADYAPTGCPNPFFTAIRGVTEEIGNEVGRSATVGSVRFIALAWDLGSFNPHLYATLRVDMKKSEVTRILAGNRAEDAWESHHVAVPFEPSGGLRERLLRGPWAEISKGALLRALVSEFGFDEVSRALR